MGRHDTMGNRVVRITTPRTELRTTHPTDVNWIPRTYCYISFSIPTTTHTTHKMAWFSSEYKSVWGRQTHDCIVLYKPYTTISIYTISASYPNSVLEYFNYLSNLDRSNCSDDSASISLSWSGSGDRDTNEVFNWVRLHINNSVYSF